VGIPREDEDNCWIRKAILLRINKSYNYPNDRRNQRRTLKTLLDAVDRNRSTSSPIQRQPIIIIIIIIIINIIIIIIIIISLVTGLFILVIHLNQQ
jgi:hypothetical protein